MRRFDEIMKESDIIRKSEERVKKLTLEGKRDAKWYREIEQRKQQKQPRPVKKLPGLDHGETRSSRE